MALPVFSSWCTLSPRGEDCTFSRAKPFPCPTARFTRLPSILRDRILFRTLCSRFAQTRIRKNHAATLIHLARHRSSRSSMDTLLTPDILGMLILAHIYHPSSSYPHSYFLFLP